MQSEHVIRPSFLFGGSPSFVEQKSQTTSLSTLLTIGVNDGDDDRDEDGTFDAKGTGDKGADTGCIPPLVLDRFGLDTVVDCEEISLCGDCNCC